MLSVRVKTTYVILVLAIIATLVYAAPNPIVSIEPVSLYESTSELFNLTVNNQFGAEVIDQVQIQMPSFTITNVVDFLGWQNNFTQTTATWYDGDIETNALELFQLTAQAGLVGADTNINVDVITDSSAGSTTDTVVVTILNDATAPVLSNNIPLDGGFLRQGITNQLISIDAVDPETGIKNVSFAYWDCGNVSTTQVLALAGTTTFTNTADLSSYLEGETMCFEFRAYNNAEELATLAGSVGFDGTAPSVYLIAPADGAYGSNNTIFSFNATDNLAPNLTCSWVVDDVVIDSATATNGAITTTTYNMENVTEGNHDWKVNCTDWVGLSAESATRNIIIDKTPPAVTLNSPANGSMIGDNVIIDMSVVDNFDPSPNVTYSIDTNSSNLPEGTNIMTVTATDAAGNTVTVDYTFIVDRTNPTLNIVSPADNASTDVHVSFIFDTNDNLDPTLDCTIYANGSVVTTREVNVTETNNVTVVMPMADYSWYITCLDGAGNSVNSGSRVIHVTDLTGPDIVSNIVYVERTADYPFDVNVTDPSGINSVTMVFNNTNMAITNNGDLYSSVIQTDLSYPLGNYTVTIDANDTLGNTNQLVDTFELVQGYVLTLNLNKNSAIPGEEVIASGTVTLDDGGAVPENNLTLHLPDETVEVAIVNNSYTYAFDADSEDVYTISAILTSTYGFIHNASDQLTISNPGGSEDDEGGSVGGGGGGSGRIRCGDGICQTTESCSTCVTDCGACPIIESSSNDDDEEVGGDEVDGLNITEEEPAEPREPIGVGAASGWFRKVAGNAWIWAIILVIAGTLYIMSSDKGDKINWNGYFEK